MDKNWTKILKRVGFETNALAMEAPEALKALNSLSIAATTPGSIDCKTKELMATAISICIRCDGCIAYHVNSAIKAGATREEMVETISVAIEMGGGPSAVYGAAALSAYEELSQ